MAASMQSGGEGGLEFPITLVEGDNGDVGKQLFQYIIDNCDISNGVYTFKENEIVTLLGVKIFDANVIFEDYIGLNFNIEQWPSGVLTANLVNDGTIIIVWD